jgi:ferredoxin
MALSTPGRSGDPDPDGHRHHRARRPDLSLPYASSLCGACYDVCPVKIDIPTILEDSYRFGRFSVGPRFSGTVRALDQVTQRPADWCPADLKTYVARGWSSTTSAATGFPVPCAGRLPFRCGTSDEG